MKWDTSSFFWSPLSLIALTSTPAPLHGIAQDPNSMYPQARPLHTLLPAWGWGHQMYLVAQLWVSHIPSPWTALTLVTEVIKGSCPLMGSHPGSQPLGLSLKSQELHSPVQISKSESAGHPHPLGQPSAKGEESRTTLQPLSFSDHQGGILHSSQTYYGSQPAVTTAV